VTDGPIAAPHPRKVRSFVRRPGRATVAQRRALAELLPRFGVAVTPRPLDLIALFGRDASRVLDIGFGDGTTSASRSSSSSRRASAWPRPLLRSARPSPR
jgi:tRNA (guanine-N7-)-methyltransferase